MSKGNGLLLSHIEPDLPCSFITSDEPVSWLDQAIHAQDQGSDGACAVFAMAGWAEVMHGKEIDNFTAIEVYRAALKKTGRQTEGLYFPEAYRAAKEAGWLPKAKGVEPVYDLYPAMKDQPLLAGYVVTQGWFNVANSGCIDHTSSSMALGYHAVLAVTCGQHATWADPRVVFENWWGRDWGWKGLGVMTYGQHAQSVRELWRIVL